MIKIIVAPLLALLLFLPGCLEDPDPIPPTINTYQIYYNYLMEPYDVQWEIDDEIIGTGHSYGILAEAIVKLDSSEQEVLIRTINSDNGFLIDSLSYSLVENGIYMVAILGTEEDPHLLCEPMNTQSPTGMTKLRLLHAAATMGPVDIYIGGDLPEHKVLSGTNYTSVSEYLEVTEENLWKAIIVTPANSLPADSTILSYTTNTIFRAGRVYLCIIEHSENYIESIYQLQVNEQPVY
ncbi:MAG: DUF4397 domain-containing protein [Bacteroidales bacterium]|nr:DUF4397 domain-containing protein [Bacteroidales bacterium]